MQQNDRLRNTILKEVGERTMRPGELVCILTCQCHEYRFDPVEVQGTFWSMVNDGMLDISGDAAVTIHDAT